MAADTITVHVGVRKHAKFWVTVAWICYRLHLPFAASIAFFAVKRSFTFTVGD